MYHGHIVRLSKLSAHLRELRESHKLTLQQVSKQTRLSISFLSDVERGKTPSLVTLSKLARCYGAEIILSIGE